jgi:hypothetical protein
MYICVFIEVSANTYINIYIYTVFLKKVSKPEMFDVIVLLD